MDEYPPPFAGPTRNASRSKTNALRDFDQYLAAHIERLSQDDDANSILADVVHNSDLTEVEIKLLVGLLLGAGFVTTTHVLGKAVLALTTQKGGRVLIPADKIAFIEFSTDQARRVGFGNVV